MSALTIRINDFLAQPRIAVAGVSRTDTNLPANLIYRKLRGTGYHVFAVNPRAESVENDRCYPSLHALPEPVDGVVIATPAGAAESLVQECAELGIRRVWMHRSLGEGSVSAHALEVCKEKNIEVIAGACPMMYAPPVDFGHKCMRLVMRITGKLPN
jgi:predicted CoA-binding protein